jgi:peptidoglycan/xylan/chitin deacetylase (PgdA/CDA1 family)
MMFVSPFLKRVLYPSLASTGYFRRRACRGELCVVTYHGVLPSGYQSKDPALDGSLVTVAALRGQLRLLKSSYNVISAEDVLQWLERNQKLPSRAVLLACDDGLQNTLTDMLPVLREEGLSCLFFVTGASIGDRSRMLWYEELYLLLMAAPAGEFAFPDLKLTARLDGYRERRSLWWNWVKDLSRHDALCRTNFLDALRIRCGLPDDWQSAYQHEATRRRFFLLTVEELRQLAASGMFVGAHTLSHPMLSQTSADLAWNEIAESRKALEAALGKPVWAMAYPFGDPESVGVREFEMTERAGYKCAFLNFGGGFPASIPRFAIPRVHVTSDMTLGEFEAHISGFYDALRQRFRPRYPASGASA